MYTNIPRTVGQQPSPPQQPIPAPPGPGREVQRELSQAFQSLDNLDRYIEFDLAPRLAALQAQQGVDPSALQQQLQSIRAELAGLRAQGALATQAGQARVADLAATIEALQPHTAYDDSRIAASIAAIQARQPFNPAPLQQRMQSLQKQHRTGLIVLGIAGLLVVIYLLIGL